MWKAACVLSMRSHSIMYIFAIDAPAGFPIAMPCDCLYISLLNVK